MSGGIVRYVRRLLSDTDRQYQGWKDREDARLAALLTRPAAEADPVAIPAHLSPLPWAYRSIHDHVVPRDWIEDAHGNIVVENVGHIDGPFIVASANAALANEPDACPICAVPFKPDDMCLSDINEGACHAECPAGSPMVDLETGEPLPEGAPAPGPYRYDSLFKDGQR